MFDKFPFPVSVPLPSRHNLESVMSYLHRTPRRPSRLPSFLWGMVVGLAIGTAVLFPWGLL